MNTTAITLLSLCAFAAPLAAHTQDARTPDLTQAEGQDAFAILWQGDKEFRASFDPSVKLVWSQDGRTFDLHQGGGVFVAKKKP